MSGIASAFTGFSTPTFSGVATFSGLVTENAGSKTSGSAPALTPTFANGTATQLTDTTRDYMVYLTVTLAGTAFSVAIGPTVTPANTIVGSVSVSAGECFTVRLPAGWFLLWSATTATIEQAAIGC